MIFALLALVLSLAAGIGSIVVVHLLIFLQARGVDFAVAVSLGTLFGPAQVGARVIERLFGARYHPIWTMIGSCALMAIGLLLLVGHFPAAGAGHSALRRRLRHFLDRPRHAAFGTVRAGAVSAPDGQTGVSQPDRAGAGAIGWARWRSKTSGADATIGVLTLLALINVLLIGLLWAVCRPQASGA